MSNNDIKKYIDLSKLYTEVDLEKNKKIEEGLLDFVKNLFSSDETPEEVVKKIDPEVVKKLDTEIDTNNVTDVVKGGGQDATDPRGDQTNPPAADSDATDPRGDQTNPPSATPRDGGNPGGTTTAVDPDATDPRGDQTTPPAADSDATDPRGDQTTPPAADSDATDPRGDQTTPPAATGEPTSRLDTKGETPPAATGEPTSRLDTKGETPPADATQSNGSLLGRKLDTTTPNLMKAYNDGGKKAMPEIKNLQTALSRLGHDPNGLDGKYGQGTYAAVQAFQKANGLSVDGQAGPSTMAAIKKALDDNFEKNKVTPADSAAAADSAGNATPGNPADDGGLGTGAVAGTQTAPQTDAENDADSADSGTPTSRLDTKGETPAPKTDTPAQTAASLVVSGQRGVQSDGKMVNFNVDQFKQYGTYIDLPSTQSPGTFVRLYGTEDALNKFIQNDKRGKGLKIQGGSQQAGQPNANADAQQRGVQTASKDNNMKKAIKEASMNISINGDSAAEVAELAGILKNAGMNTTVDMPMAPTHNNGHDDMMSKMAIMDEPEADTPCGMDEEGVEEEWDNTPEESYADHQTMTHDLSGGINRQKKSYAAAQDGDNAMAVETSIKEQLWAALNEKMTAEGRGRGKKLKASRGEKLNASRGSKLMASRGRGKKK